MELDFAETDSKDSGIADQEQDVLTKDVAEVKLTDDILNDICLEISKDKVEDLKFLGSHIKEIQWKEVQDASHFFKKLQTLFDQEKFSFYVVELLFRIKRYDLLPKIGISKQTVQGIIQAKSVLDPLTKLLFDILDSVDENKANDIANKLSQLCCPSKHSLDLRGLFSKLISDKNRKQCFLQTLHSLLINQNNELVNELQPFLSDANWVSESPIDTSLFGNNESSANIKEASASASSLDADEFYDSPCGKCVIINIEKYKEGDSEEDKIPDREGTNFDRDNLKTTFERFCFETVVKDDLKSYEIRDLLKEMAEADHKNCSCFVCCILSHCQEQIITAADNKPLDIYEDIIYRFSAIKCPSLANKPKLFFIQACQGDAMMRPATLDVEEDGWEACMESKNKNPPSVSDFLLAHATVPKYKAFRLKKSGSIFISCLIEELLKNGHRFNILDILTNVNRKVANKDISSRKDKKIKKQMPYFISTLRKKLIFNIKGEN